MGLDFLSPSAPSFTKAVSRDANAVARMAGSVSSAGHRRVVMAESTAGSGIVEGQCLIVKESDQQLILVCGLHEVGRVTSPPPDVLGAIRALGGFTEGVVEHVNSIGGTFDVALP